MARIYTPVEGYNGVSASVRFVDGAGETSDAYLISWFKAHGYRVEEKKPSRVRKKPVQDEVE